jgi:hypothetical protein
MNTVITVFAGNLFAIAAEQLGDATQWIRIAKLNNISDPVIREVTILKIPSVDPSAGGGIVAQP